MTPVGFAIATFGYVGLRYQCAIIFDAIKDRYGIFVRCFNFNEIKRNDFPVLSRLCKDGIGDVILSQDGHWEYDIDFNQLPWFKINMVGFLSVPDAKRIMDKIEQAVAIEHETLQGDQT
ncbi:MAG: hypothetical protein KZQ96_05680 [Candidatus Thiodiazotropha sp. (ex Lucinoma borealis)]|nr:hypothetical protein [Candidatus Thiodiazotropha sp. (ex Lucinoma borealis)]MCU7870117.1 hypothetical protein [Candidatus Thiodiazotropha sp. (ex Lucinoma borealis)]